MIGSHQNWIKAVMDTISEIVQIEPPVRLEKSGKTEQDQQGNSQTTGTDSWEYRMKNRWHGFPPRRIIKASWKKLFKVMCFGKLLSRGGYRAFEISLNPTSPPQGSHNKEDRDNVCNRTRWYDMLKNLQQESVGTNRAGRSLWRQWLCRRTQGGNRCLPASEQRNATAVTKNFPSFTLTFKQSLQRSCCVHLRTLVCVPMILP